MFKFVKNLVKSLNCSRLLAPKVYGQRKTSVKSCGMNYPYSGKLRRKKNVTLEVGVSLAFEGKFSKKNDFFLAKFKLNIILHQKCE